MLDCRALKHRVRCRFCHSAPKYYLPTGGIYYNTPDNCSPSRIYMDADDFNPKENFRKRHLLEFHGTVGTSKISSYFFKKSKFKPRVITFILICSCYKSNWLVNSDSSDLNNRIRKVDLFQYKRRVFSNYRKKNEYT